MTNSQSLRPGDYHLAGANIAVLGACLAPNLPGAGPSLFLLIGCYLLGLALAACIDRVATPIRPGLLRRGRLSFAVTLAVLLVCAWGKWPALIANEGWGRHCRRTRERFFDALLPSLHPSVVYLGQPQRFYLRTTPSSAVTVTLKIADKASPLPTVALSSDVHFFDLAPESIAPEPPPETIQLVIAWAGGAKTFTLPVIPANPQPRQLFAHPNGDCAVSPSEPDDTLYVIDSRGRAQALTTGDGPTGAVVGRQGHAWVCHRFEPLLLEFAIDSGHVARSLPTVPCQTAIALSPDEHQLAIAVAGVENCILLVDLEKWEIRRRIALPSAPEWIAYGRHSGELIVASRRDPSILLVRWDPAELAVPAAEPRITWIPLYRPVRDLARNGDGSHCYFTSGGHASDGTLLLGNHQVEHQLLDLDLASGTIVTITDLAGLSRQNPEDGWKHGIDPMGLCIVGGTVWVACSGSNELLSLKPGSDSPVIVRRSLRSSSLCVPSDVAPLKDGQMLVVDPVAGRFLVIGPGGAWTAIAIPQPAPRRSAGEAAFYRGTRAGISCNSCHPHGDTDYAFHNIGSAILQTPSLRGIFLSAPYLRQGAHDSIADLHQALAIDLFGGYPDGPGPDPDALDEFVTRLPMSVNPFWATTDPAVMRRGYELFVRSGCARCHSPPRFTNLSQHPETWLFPSQPTSNALRALDVPSLLSLWQKTHFLYDGRADSLEALFTRWNPDNRHGDTRSWTKEDRRLMEAFLKNL